MRHKADYRLWKRGKYFYLRLPGGGWVSTGKTTRSAAEREAIQKIREGGAAIGASLREYADPYFIMERCPHIRRLLDEGKTYGPRTARGNRSWLERHVFTDPIADLAMGEITRADLIDFRSRLRAKLGDKIVSTNKTMGALKTIFREALFRQDIRSDPASGIGNIREKRRPPDTFALEELQLLFPTESLGPWQSLLDHTCFLLAAATGMRRGELLALRWEQVHAEDGYVVVDRARKDTATEGAPKWEHKRIARIVLFRDRVEQRLQELKSESVFTAPRNYVFCDAAGKPKPYAWWKASFDAAMTTFDPQTERKLSPHGLRHSLATMLRAAGKDPALIRASLGWFEEKTQARYEHLAAQDLAGLDISWPTDPLLRSLHPE